MYYGLYCGKERYNAHINPFEGGGSWFKGNLHTHTTRSDGSLSPEKAVEFYKRSGYDFLCLSDHHVYTNDPSLDSKDFIVLPGIELDVTHNAKNLDRQGRPSSVGYHQNAILCDFEHENPIPHDFREDYADVNREDLTLKEAVSIVNERYVNRGNMVILNHPLWSRHICTDSFGIRGIFAMEIYNHVCEISCKTGLATTHWDYLLRRGQRVYGVAADDTHFRQGGNPRGSVIVKAEGLNAKSITSAIKNGRFYSSTGPEIYEYYLEGHTVMLKCSPVKRIKLIKYEPMGKTVDAPDNGFITQAEISVNGNEKYVRAEITDENGYAAWTNPIFLHDEQSEK